MSSRERAITVLAIQKSMIEAGMTTPDENFVRILEAFLAIHDRVVGPIAQQSTPVHVQQQQPSNGGGYRDLTEIPTGGAMPTQGVVQSLEDKGKYVRAQVDNQWFSAWDTDAEVLRNQVRVGQTISFQVKASGQHKNLKKVQPIGQPVSQHVSDIPF